ncbi:MAG: diaminopimelate epimerase [Pseudomonadota bacterium]|nr:diaminopimelate epimerase [Pseudomonadota bacterium]MDE3038069.1 diaminopimelate epimerase [Pseudomonadota bacterium]
MFLSFIKMHGAGNDFVMFDARRQPVALTPGQVRQIAARSNAVTQGCDQVIVLEPSRAADIFMRIHNADGGEVAACGNATRCVASLLEEELKRLPVKIETKAGILQGLEKAYTPGGEEYILVDMGAPRLDWQDIPLAFPLQESAEKVERFCDLKNPAFVSMGNPHMVFFLRFDPAESATDADSADLANMDLAHIGSALEHYTEVFPEGVNVSVATLRAAKDGLGHIIHARVWERGAGLTKACGTAACAMLAAAHARNAVVRQAHLWFEPEGYAVTVKFDDSGHILLGGPVETEFEGTWNV